MCLKVLTYKGSKGIHISDILQKIFKDDCFISEVICKQYLVVLDGYEKNELKTILKI